MVTHIHTHTHVTKDTCISRVTSILQAVGEHAEKAPRRVKLVAGDIQGSFPATSAHAALMINDKEKAALLDGFLHETYKRRVQKVRSLTLLHFISAI